jgi:hypothetical protein
MIKNIYLIVFEVFIHFIKLQLSFICLECAECCLLYVVSGNATYFQVQRLDKIEDVTW